MGSTPWRDRNFWAALLAGPLFLAVLFALTHPIIRLAWPLARASMFLLLAVVYPVLEEIVFRGGLQGQLRRWLTTSWRVGVVSLPNLLTSLVFSAMHLFYHPPLWAAAVVLPSLVFGYFKDKYPGLAAPIVLHITYNTGYYWLFGGQ